MMRAIFVIPLVLAAMTNAAAGATQIWPSGPNDLTFTKSDATPVDMITPGVGIARDSTEGIYNSVQEQSFQRFTSPADTEWAFSGIDGNPTFAYGDGTAATGLAYSSWTTALGGPGHSLGANIVGTPGVLRLITDDVLINIEFLAWGGAGSAAFSYMRSGAPGGAGLPGDTNNDGVINMDDYLVIDNGFLKQLTGVANGDFDGSGTIDGADYAIIDGSFGSQTPHGQLAGVPEPASAALLAAGASGVLLGRRRRRVATPPSLRVLFGP